MVSNKALSSSLGVATVGKVFSVSSYSHKALIAV